MEKTVEAVVAEMFSDSNSQSPPCEAEGGEERSEGAVLPYFFVIPVSPAMRTDINT
ncbi:MAG: hypothetical protein V3S46_03630 [Nitrospinota bacterium]